MCAAQPEEPLDLGDEGWCLGCGAIDEQPSLKSVEENEHVADVDARTASSFGEPIKEAAPLGGC
ncbi:hypothetical protein OL599_21205 [Rhodovastum sp. RN2-1]|uniref:Uncharacterized protein n=1 Tax=Limobrevibacterium gyesilva TaxID=2991712 RepID=A0AA42CJP1_9PROT|nr:hypothetical protein [Limobrevibacterium gyesilva]MCW3477092.1 hypothetical protein [Limobrevibacterium gyesilva]